MQVYRVDSLIEVCQTPADCYSASCRTSWSKPRAETGEHVWTGSHPVHCLHVGISLSCCVSVSKKTLVSLSWHLRRPTAQARATPPPQVCFCWRFFSPVKKVLFSFSLSPNGWSEKIHCSLLGSLVSLFSMNWHLIHFTFCTQLKLIDEAINNNGLDWIWTYIIGIYKVPWDDFIVKWCHTNQTNWSPRLLLMSFPLGIVLTHT